MKRAVAEDDGEEARNRFSSVSARPKRLRKVMETAVTHYDYEQLKQHYIFLPEEAAIPPETGSSATAHPAGSSGTARRTGTSWQDRMVLEYHRHLYKDYVLADTTRVSSHKQLGLRWRTAAEVKSGKGSKSCGNLQCPKQEQQQTTQQKRPTRPDANDQPENKEPNDEVTNVARYLRHENEENLRSNERNNSSEAESQEKSMLSKVPFGSLLSDYEVPFTYREHGKTKTELVRLCLCVCCAPLLFLSKGDPTPSLTARRKRMSLQSPSSSSSKYGDDEA